MFIGDLAYYEKVIKNIETLLRENNELEEEENKE